MKLIINVDLFKLFLGIVLNFFKGFDCWGGSEFKDIDILIGWGDIVEEFGNWYDDGSIFWFSFSLLYGVSGGWSWNS